MNRQIFSLTAPYSNPYQGSRKRLLFVCSAGLLRSPTGAYVGSMRGYNTRSCGSSDYALVPISANLIMWAEKIIFVNRDNFEEALDTFEDTAYETALCGKSVALDIPDRYEAFSPKLVAIWNSWFDEFEGQGH